MTIDKFEEMLQKHQWMYHLSDDIRIWRKGHESRARIDCELREHPEWDALHQAYWDYHYSGALFGRPKMTDDEFNYKRFKAKE